MMPHFIDLRLVFPEENERDKATHLSTIDVDPKIWSIIDGYLQPSSRVSKEATAQEIIKLYPKDPDSTVPGPKDKKSDFLLQLWTLVIAAVDQIPWQHPSQEKVVELLATIRDQPNPATVDFDNWETWKNFTLWSDLPLISFVLADEIEAHGVQIPDNSVTEKANRIRDLNFQGFATQMTLAGVRDLSYVGVFRLRNVLEEDPNYDHPHFTDIGVHLDVRILPAEIWVTRCAKILYQHSKENGGNASGNHIAGGKHWKGKAGFSMERWHFWMERLHAIVLNEEASEQTRGIAKEMKKIMIEVEVEDGG